MKASIEAGWAERFDYTTALSLLQRFPLIHLERMERVLCNAGSFSRENLEVGVIIGGQGRNRTADAGLFRAALYQLSYLARWFGKRA